MKRRSIHPAMRRLADAESAFLASEFLAPVVRDGVVVVRIAGVRCAMAVEPNGFDGWGVFRPMSVVAARLVRRASQAERRRYLELFRPVRLVVVGRGGDGAIEAVDDGVGGHTPIVVHLAEDVQRFDSIVARFDGGRVWFDEVDPRADPATPAYLRERLLANVAPEALDRPGLTPGQRAAFGLIVERRLAAERVAELQRGEGRLKLALKHAGAELRDFAETADAYRVTYTVDGRRHVSVVGKNDLTVQSAGICLSGEDRKFDLASLVGVLREGSGAGELRRGPGVLT